MCAFEYKTPSVAIVWLCQKRDNAGKNVMLMKKKNYNKTVKKKMIIESYLYTSNNPIIYIGIYIILKV